jgi:hypothetical protein
MIFPKDMASLDQCEAYADRCLRRVERRLLLVRAEQAYHQRMLDLAKSDPQSHWIGVPQQMVARLEELASRLIRRRDRYTVEFLAILDPVHLR